MHRPLNPGNRVRLSVGSLRGRQRQDAGLISGYYKCMPLKDPEARRAYQREYMRRYFADNPRRKAEHLARVGANNDRYEQEKRRWIANYLLGHPCVDCGETDRDVLDFDHVRGVKLFGIATAARRGYSMEVLIAEVAKCEVRCANCHRNVTRQRERSGVVELGTTLGS